MWKNSPDLIARFLAGAAAVDEMIKARDARRVVGINKGRKLKETRRIHREAAAQSEQNAAALRARAFPD